LQVLANGDIHGYQDSNRLQQHRPRHGITEDNYVEPEPETMAVDGPEEPDTLLYAEACTCHNSSGETRRVLSWIWCVAGASKEDGTDEILCVEWAKSHARSHRATEEVCQLKEEMRRVLETTKWEEAEWKGHADLQTGTTCDLAEGICALSVTQASIKYVLRIHFEKLWKSLLEEVAEPVVSTQLGDAENNDDNDEDPDSDNEDEEGDGFGVPSLSAQTDSNDEDSNILGH